MDDFQKGILKSAFHSVRIEGNTISYKDAKRAVENILEKRLLPRRLEILQIIRDHKQVSFNFLKRRFFSVSDRLLRYDLKKLQDAKFITKRGITKGVIYEPA